MFNKMSLESDNKEISYNSESMHDNLNARCNCDFAATDSGYYNAKMYKWNHLGRNEPLTFQCQPMTLQANNRVRNELMRGERREFKSLSYPDKSFIIERKKYSVDTTESPAKHLSDALAIYSRRNPSMCSDAKYRAASQSSEHNIEIQSTNSRIDGAKQFLAQSGILGTTNITSSCDLIRKTSSIHIDATLRDQIRKTSLCLRSKICIEKNTPKSYDELIHSLQYEVDALKGIIDNGETKIITLRTEIGKLKRVLQEIMHVQMVASSSAGDGLSTTSKGTTLCLFVNPEAGRAKIKIQNCLDRVFQH